MHGRLAAAATAWACLLGAIGAPTGRAAQIDIAVQDSSLYLETDRDAEKLLETARAAARAENWRQALESYQRVADFTGKKGAQPLVAAAGTRGVFLPIQDVAALEIARLPRAGVEAYRQTYDAVAARLYERALTAKDSVKLAEVARHYLASSSGEKALAAIGSLAFERGDLIGALAAWQQIVELRPPKGGTPNKDPRPPKGGTPNEELRPPKGGTPNEDREVGVPAASLLARIWLSHRALGRERAAETWAKLLLNHRDPAATIQAGGAEIRVVDFLKQPLTLAMPGPLRDWPELGGDATHGRLSKGIAELGEPIAAIRLPAAAVSEVDRRDFEARGLDAPLPLVATVSQGRLFAATESAAFAFDPATGRAAWLYPDGPEASYPAAIDEVIHTVACSEGRAFARVADGVVAFDASTGRLLWRYGFAPLEEPPKDAEARPPKGGTPNAEPPKGGAPNPEKRPPKGGTPNEEKKPPKEPKARRGKGEGSAGSHATLLATPPVVEGRRVFVGLTHLGEEARATLVALDAATGRELWRTFVCSRSIRSFLGLGATGSPPAVSGGTVYYSTNLGALAALDAATGAIRWVQRYPSFHGQLRQAVLERSRRWANNPPIVDRGWVFLAPQDSSSAFAIEATSGAIAWSAPRDGARFLVGVDGSRLFLAGPTVYALDETTGRRLWATPLPHPTAGRPALAPGRLYVPTSRGIVSLQTQDGALATSRLWQGTEQPGNLTLAAGKLIVASSDRLRVYEDWASAEARWQERTKANPKDLAPQLAMAAHRVHRGEYATVLPLLDTVRLGAAATKAAAVEAKARRGLFTCYKALGEAGDAKALGRAAEVAPSPSEGADVLQALARVHEGAERWPEAIAAYQDILRRFPAGRCRIANGSAGASPSRGLTLGARELATAETSRLIQEHGREVYAAQETAAKKLLLAAKQPSEFDEVVRLFPNSDAAEQAVLERLCQPGAEKIASELGVLAASLGSDPASPARDIVATKLAALRRQAPDNHTRLTQCWQVYTRIAMRRIEALRLPGAAASLVYFATARSSFPRTLPFDSIECRRIETGQLVWQRDLGEWDCRAVLADNQLVLALFDRVVAVDAATGIFGWGYSLADDKPIGEADLAGAADEPGDRRRRNELRRVNALAGSRAAVYVGMAGGQVVALSSNEGRVLWRRTLTAGPLLANGLIPDGDRLWACIEQPATLYALNPADGTGEPALAAKKREGEDRLMALPRVTDRPTHDPQQHKLYLVLDGRTVRAIDLRAGRDLWEASMPFGISSLLVSPDGQRCYVVPDKYVAEGQIVALDPATGAVRRRRSLRTGSLEDARFEGGALYLATKDTERDLVVQALDPDDLGERWRSVPLPLFRPSKLAVGEGFLALSGRYAAQNVAILVDTSNGRIVGDVKPEGATSVHVDFVDDVLCLSTDRGIHAYSATPPEQLDQRVVALRERVDAGDREAVAPLASTLYQRGDLEAAVGLLAQALTDEALTEPEYASLKDQLNSVREALAERKPVVMPTVQFATPPLIDGAIDEPWHAEHAARLDNPAYIEEIQGVPLSEARWHSPGDLSAVLYTGWDARSFYFAVDVTDDIHRTYASHTETWIGDGLIISIDCDNDGGYGYSFNGRDLLLTLALTRKDDRKQDEDNESPEGDYRVRRKDDNSGTVYEVSIPWNYLSMEPKAGMRFGFNVTVIDDDGDRAAKAVTWTPGLFLDRNHLLMTRGFTPAYFGKIELVGPPGSGSPLWSPATEPEMEPEPEAEEPK